MEKKENASSSNKDEKKEVNFFAKYAGREDLFSSVKDKNETKMSETSKQQVNNENNSNNNTLFGDNNKTLFGESKSLFGENNKTLFGDSKTLFDKTEQFFPKSKSLFGDDTNNDNNSKSLFEKNENLFACNKTRKKKRKAKSKKEEESDSSSEEDNDKKSNSEKVDNGNILDEIDKEKEEEGGDEEDEEGEGEGKEEEEEGNEDNGEEEIEKEEKIKTRFFKGKLKWYSKKKNVPKPTSILAENKYLKNNAVKCNSEIKSFFHLREEFENYIDIKELKNKNIVVLFEKELFYFSSNTFKLLKIEESLHKIIKDNEFLEIEEINKDLIGLITKEFVLIIQVNDKELKLFQKIQIKANILKSFEEGKLIILNEYVEIDKDEENDQYDDEDEEDDKTNILNFYTYDKELKYTLKSSVTLNFKKFSKKGLEEYDIFNRISNIIEYKSDYYILFTQSTIPEAEVQEFDSDYRSFYERDCRFFLNIYLYEKNSKQLKRVYKNNYKIHLKYSFSIYDSDYADFIHIWKNENINFLNENEIIFLNSNKSEFVKVNLETELSEILLPKINNLKSYSYDKKNNLYYCVNEEKLKEEQIIQVFKFVDNKFEEIKKIYLPHYYSTIFFNIKGDLIGVVKNTEIVYSFYYHWGKYAPAIRTYTSIFLLNIL